MCDKELELKEESNLVLAMLTKKTIRDLTRLEAVDMANVIIALICVANMFREAIADNLPKLVPVKPPRKSGEGLGKRGKLKKNGREALVKNTMSLLVDTLQQDHEKIGHKLVDMLGENASPPKGKAMELLRKCMDEMMTHNCRLAKAFAEDVYSGNDHVGKAVLLHGWPESGEFTAEQMANLDLVAELLEEEQNES